MNYKINKQASYWEIEAEKTISIEDCCYDVTTDTFVIAVKHNRGGDYIVLNRAHKIVRTVSEGQGLNRKFVLAPDKSVWIGMSATCTKKDGEIILPLYDRERVEKEIVKSDLGVDYSFFWNGCHWGYVNDIFGDKTDKLLQYQFDKNGLYKTRKAYKLDMLRHAVPFVQGDCLYLCQKDYKNGIVQIFKMTEPGNPEEVCEPISVGELGWCRLVNADESGYKIIGIEHDEISMLFIDRKGKLLDKTLLYRLDVPEVYSIKDFGVTEEGVVAFGYVSEKQAGIIEIKDSVVKKVLWQKDNVLYSKAAEIKTENKLAFHIMTDGRKNYYMATNIGGCGGRSKKIYVVDEV